MIRFAAEDLSDGQFAVVTQPEAAPYTAILTALRAGTFDLGIVAMAEDGELRQVVFRALSVVAGERLMATIRPGSDPLVVLERGGAPLEPSLEDLIVDGPPEVLGIVQIADPSVDIFGRVVGILFDEDVEAASAQDPDSYGIGAASIPVIPPPALIRT